MKEPCLQLRQTFVSVKEPAYTHTTTPAPGSHWVFYHPSPWFTLGINTPPLLQFLILTGHTYTTTTAAPGSYWEYTHHHLYPSLWFTLGTQPPPLPPSPPQLLIHAEHIHTTTTRVPGLHWVHTHRHHPAPGSHWAYTHHHHHHSSWFTLGIYTLPPPQPLVHTGHIHTSNTPASGSH